MTKRWGKNDSLHASKPPCLDQSQRKVLLKREVEISYIFNGVGTSTVSTVSVLYVTQEYLLFAIRELLYSSIVKALILYLLGKNPRCHLSAGGYVQCHRWY
jgi:hypothetical protein